MRLTVTLAVGALLLVGCGGGEAAPVSSSPSPSPTSASPSASPSPLPPPSDGIPPGASPFSGLPGGEGKPVLAIKIDNTRPAQPHAGLQAADLVYVTEVEWDLTRFIAIFNSQIPDVIGPVRSARPRLHDWRRWALQHCDGTSLPPLLSL